MIFILSRQPILEGVPFLKMPKLRDFRAKGIQYLLVDTIERMVSMKNKFLVCMILALLFMLFLTSCAERSNVNQSTYDNNETEDHESLESGNEYENNSDNSSEGVLEEVPQSSQDDSDSPRIDLERAYSSVESSVKKNYFPDGNCDFSYGDNSFTVITWDDTYNQTYALIMTGLAQGKEDGLVLWDYVIEMAQTYSKSIENVFGILGYSDITVAVRVVDALNHDNVWLIADKDSVLFNIMDRVENVFPSGGTTKSQTFEASEKANVLETVPEAEPKPAEVKVDAQVIKSRLLAIIPQMYQGDSMFFLDVYVNSDNTVDIMLQLDQKSSSKDAALSLASEYYNAAESASVDAGGQMGRYDVMILNNGSPVGDYVTDDGNNYSVVADGKVTSIDIS